MSKLDYSKWDKLELSDDEDVECHPNIDKASWIRWRQADIHRKREERKLKIQSLTQEHKTNQGLRSRLVENVPLLRGSTGREQAQKLYQSVKTYETERKPKIFDSNSEEYMQPKDEDEVFSMLVSRLCNEQGVPDSIDGYYERLADVFEAEVPKLDKRQAEVLDTIANEEHEQNKKITSENIFQEKFSKTIVNTKDSPKKSKGNKESTVEVLNPGYEKVHQKRSGSPTRKSVDDDVNLRELSLAEEKMMLNFAKIESFEDSYKYIQENTAIVSREYADHLMARAFKLQMENRSKEARLCTKWSLALSYSMQMGPDGVGLFYKRLTSENPEPKAVFEADIEQTFNRIKERSKILKQKEKEVSPENSNLTPEQAEAFKTFPKYFQDALLSNDIEKINDAFRVMGEEKASEVMEKCQTCGLISVLSDEEAKKFQEQQEQEAGAETQKQSEV